jgi:hypothetical protein
MLVLDRIQGGDLVTAYRLLRVIVASAHLATPGADREYGPFGFSLVGILHVSLFLCLPRGTWGRRRGACMVLCTWLASIEHRWVASRWRTWGCVGGGGMPICHPGAYNKYDLVGVSLIGIPHVSTSFCGCGGAEDTCVRVDSLLDVHGVFMLLFVSTGASVQQPAVRCQQILAGCLRRGAAQSGGRGAEQKGRTGRWWRARWFPVFVSITRPSLCATIARLQAKLAQPHTQPHPPGAVGPLLLPL